MAAVTAVMSLRTAVGAAFSRNLVLDWRFAVAPRDRFSYNFSNKFVMFDAGQS